jgi:subfamily B ATP-binding cassette protein HlyB/CyaB
MLRFPNKFGQEEADDAGAQAPVPALDTGLNCLLLLARFYDLPADGAQLRHQFAQSGQPLSDVDLLRAAKHLGLKAGTLKTQWSKLPGTPLPAIVKRKNGRYLVLAKIDEAKALIQDPADGNPRIVSRAQFESVWSGQLLLFTKRANLRLQDLKFDFTWFIPAIVKYRKFLGEVLVASFFLQLFALLTPLFTQVIIDKVLVHKGFTTLYVLAVGMIGMALFDAILVGCGPISFLIQRTGSMSRWARSCSAMSWRSPWPISRRDGWGTRSPGCVNWSISGSS